MAVESGVVLPGDVCGRSCTGLNLLTTIQRVLPLGRLPKLRALPICAGVLCVYLKAR